LDVCGLGDCEWDGVGCVEGVGASFPMDYVSWWKFDGNADDEAGRNNGTLMGDAHTTYDIERDYGADTTGEVLSLDGVGDYVSTTVPELTFNDGDEYTVSAWFEFERDNSWQSVFGKANRLAHTDQRGVVLLGYSQTTYVELYVGTKKIRVYNDFNNWHHAVVTMDSNKNVSIYIDGVFVNSVVVSDDLTSGNTRPFYIGRDQTSQYPNGSIDDVIFYDRALSAAEISEIYDAQVSPCMGIFQCSNYLDSESCVSDSCNIGLSCEWDGSSCTIVGDTWYVRPEGGIYGIEDGSNYANAWNGLKNVVWGLNGVGVSDTLYVCGMHLINYTIGSDALSHWYINASGTSENTRIIIRGDCPGDQGIIWGTHIMGGPLNQWTYVGNNTYNSTSSSYSGSFFEDVSETSWKVLNRVNSVQEVMDTPGSYYSPTYNYPDPVYVHASDGGDPTNRIVAGSNGWYVDLSKIQSDDQYITFKSIKFYASKFPGAKTHVRWEDSILWYGKLRFLDGSHHVEFINCDIGYSGGGIGFQDPEPPYIVDAPHNITISGCKIHDIGTYPENKNVDSEGIGVNGAYGMLIENNEFYNITRAVTFYPYDSQVAVNNTIRWNWVHDTHTIGGGAEGGIQFNFGALANNTEGNKIYGNIVGPRVNGAGYRSKYNDTVEFYNNICYECGTSFYFINHLEPINVKLKNLISINPQDYHIYFGSNGAVSEYSIDSDYNLFWPILGEQFYFREYSTGTTYHLNLTGWQAMSKSGSVFDPNSLNVDPLFVSADPQVPADFKLQVGSLAIDVGVDVGLTQDYDGVGIPQGGGPDIGAYEK
jgi:hypothetical protein